MTRRTKWIAKVVVAAVLTVLVGQAVSPTVVRAQGAIAQPQGDPTGATTGTAKDVTVKDAANPSLSEVMETVGHNKVAINFVWTLLAGFLVAAALVVLGNSIALYNPPLRVAEEFAMLDVLSGGRLIAGFPVGTSMDTNYAYGTVPALTREKYAEAHDLIKKAWTADEPFAFNGRYTKLRYVNCWPKPVQRPLPVFIPGGGSVETYDFCIDNTYSYSYLSYSGYLRAKLLMEGYWKRIAERKVDESPYRAGFAQVICVADTDEEAERLYWPHVSYFYNRCLHVYPGFADAPGYRTIKTIQTGALSQFAPGSGRDYPNMSWKDLTEGRYIVAGSPETVRQQMEELIKTLRVGNVFGLFHLGNMPDDKVRYSTKLFAEKVMPHLRNLWPEWKNHDDRFWCHPMHEPVPTRVAAE